MKKIFLTIFTVLIFITSAFAANIKNDFVSIINDSEIDINTVSISIKDLKNGKTVYSLNDKILMHPASVQKLLTQPAIQEALGENYNFETKIYSRGNDAYIIKLGADPYLTSNDLKILVNKINPETVKTIYIDNSIIENKDWGEGWQWDDDMNVLMPRFNSYNLDKNIAKITIIPDKNNDKTIIINQSKYPYAIFNNVKVGPEQKLDVKRETSLSSNTLTLSGTINRSTIITIPIQNLNKYFDYKLTETLANRHIYLKNDFVRDVVKPSDVEIGVVSHSARNAYSEILKKSNNLMAETTSKLAANKKFNQTGTDILGIELFKQFCVKENIDISNIRIVDASGVSKNNLVSSDFVSEFLLKNNNNPTMKLLALPGEGTLTHRLLPLRGNLKAKTGTLADISSIAGYITTQSGNNYAFCIMINSPSSTEADMKSLEDYLIRNMYFKL